MQDAMEAMIGMAKDPEVFPLVLMSMLAQKMGYRPAYQSGYAGYEISMFERMWNDMLNSEKDLTCPCEMNGYLNDLINDSYNAVDAVKAMNNYLNELLS